MTTTQEQAAKVVKDATGWDVTDSNGEGAVALRPNGATLHLRLSRSGKWKCEVNPHGWLGEGPTPEAAIADVYPRYRRDHLTALAADVPSGQPRLGWERDGDWFYLRLAIDNLPVALWTGKACTPMAPAGCTARSKTHWDRQRPG